MKLSWLHQIDWDNSSLKIILSISITVVLLIFLVPSLKGSNSSPQNTIKVCSTCEFSTINQAITEADSFDTIIISEGKYRESLIIDKPLTLVGSGSNTIIEDKSSIDPVFVVATEMGQVKINNLKINCNSGAPSSQSFNTFYSARTNLQVAIVIKGNSTLKINDTTILGKPGEWGTSIKVLDQAKLFAQNNVIKGNGYAGIWVKDKSFAFVSNNEITKNLIGIRGFGESMALITENEIMDNMIGIRTDGRFSSIISKNMLKGNRYGGKLTGSSNLIISGNTIINNKFGLYGLSFQGELSGSENVFDKNEEDTFKIEGYKEYSEDKKSK